MIVMKDNVFLIFTKNIRKVGRSVLNRKTNTYQTEICALFLMPVLTTVELHVHLV